MSSATKNKRQTKHLAVSRSGDLPSRSGLLEKTPCRILTFAMTVSSQHSQWATIDVLVERAFLGYNLRPV